MAIDQNFPDIVNPEDKKDITIKIYKSSDNSTDLLEDNLDVDSSFEESIITKDDFLQNRVQEQPASVSSQYSKPLPKNSFIPWAFIFFFVLILILLLKLIKEKTI